MLNDVKLSRRRVLAVGSAFAATAILAACGEADDDPAGNGGASSDDPTATPEPQPTATPAAEPIFAAEGDEPVIKVAYEGGFLAVEDLVRRTPLTALYDDGRLIYPGPIPEIFPQPAAPNLLVTALSGAGMQAVGEKVLETGLFEDGDKEFDSSSSILADAAHTVFTVRLSGQDPVRVSAYALEFDTDESALPAEEAEARRQLRELLNYLTGAPTGFPTDHIAEQETRYSPERLQIVTYSWDEAGYDFEMEPQTLTWPLDEAPSTLGEPFNLPGHDARCAVLEGDDLDRMLEALREANILTRWEHLEEAAYLINRPLLPGEEGCESSFEPGNDPQTGGDIDYPTGEDDLVLRYELTGGFVPLEWLVTSMPVHSLYGAGRMISEGAQIAIYPPPALPALAVEKLTEEGVQMLLSEADSAGLLQGEQTWDGLTRSVADAHTGVLTINAKGETHVVSVYAPGMFDVGDMVSDEEVEFRARFDEFVGKLSNLRGWLPEDVFQDATDEYPVDRLQIVSQPADVRPAEEDVQPNEIEWPLEAPLAELGEPYNLLDMARCFALEGQEFADVMSLLGDATTITRWTSDGEQYILHVRPLLPDEEGCRHPYQ
ncbi:MAG: hypothetical protein R3A46_07610 [Thermomicrobiales bacterium]